MDQAWQDEILKAFREAGFEQPGVEARALLRAADSVEIAKRWVTERLRGVPLAYLCRRKGFFKNEFHVQPGVLIPRPETEHVVEVALRRAGTVERFADLGCGSGCIGLSLLNEWPRAELFAIDVSELATGTTLQNAEALGLARRTVTVKTLVDDWKPDLSFDVIVANPPYIAEGDPSVEPYVHQFEPHAALYSGEDGLDALRSWTRWALAFLKPNGLFVTEIGAGQSPQIRDILTEMGFRKIEVEKDLSGHDRVVSAIK